MKKILATVFVFGFLAMSPAFATTVHVGVDGLVCAFCVKGIEKTFKSRSETESISVNMDEKLVTLVTKDGADISDQDITDMITKAGYKVTSIERQ